MKGRVKRAIVFRLARTWIGEVARAAVVLNPQFIGPLDRVRIAPTAFIQNALVNTNSGTITVGEDSFFGHGVSLLTGAHDVTKTRKERHPFPSEGRDIAIGDGVWLASNVTVIGPCVIGDDAVVYAGAVVTRDVAARTIVAGIPARAISTIDGDRPLAPVPRPGEGDGLPDRLT